VRDAFYDYTVLVERAESCEKESRYSSHWPQKAKWHLDAMSLYVRAVKELSEKLSAESELSAAMGELVSYLADYRASESFAHADAWIKELEQEIDDAPVFFSLQKNKVVLEEKVEEEPFEQRIVHAFRLPEEEKGTASFSESETLTLLEKILAERIVKQRNWRKGMELLLGIPMDETLVQLAKDVWYYLAFFRFVAHMEEKGYPFCMPEEGGRLTIRSGYDLAMAVGSDTPVVSNDLYMDEGEHFFVITGANGGGKTTFARMVGQILYFCRMGLLVPCEGAVLPWYDDLLSHFSNDESEMSGRGKLVEELSRLQPMMKEDCRNHFVILNELFTTAATLDAGIMGRKVLDHFMRADCCGIYVTHIQSLAEEHEGVVSMVAELLEDHHTRSFKIARKPAAEGEYEDSIITKYHMTYEQMQGVIGHDD
jgi:DNA mismatch repair ATPase MutS